jgi:hypothetical protein
MSGYRLVWIAILAAVFSSSTLLSQTAQAQPKGQWTGSATCTLKTTGPNYSDLQIHTWRIGYPPFVTTSGAFTYYRYTWTVTGGGGNSTSTWQINGGSKITGYFQTHVDPNGKLHFAQGSTGLDPFGIRLSSFPFRYNVFETDFPAIVVPATPHLRILQGQTKRPIVVNGPVGYQQPGGSTTKKTCSWSFRLQ